MCKFWLEYKNKEKQKLRESLLKEIKEKLPAFEEMAEKAKSVPPNPHGQDYHEKLVKIIEVQDTAQDNFINWITGITSGSIFFSLSKILPPTLDLVTTSKVVFFLGFGFFTLFASLGFKLFSHNRFNYLKLEAEMLSVLWKSHELKTKIESDLKESGKVDLDVEIAFLKNHLHNINLADPAYVLKIKKKVIFKSTLLDFFYKLALSLFLVSIGSGFYFLVA